jgi:hypothetical protein
MLIIAAILIAWLFGGINGWVALLLVALVLLGAD